jgi:hypothetical protein
MGGAKHSPAAEKDSKTTSGWVVLWATCPTSNYLTLPRGVAKILGCTREDLAKLRRSQRAIAFLARPDGTVQVVDMHRHADLVAQALHQNEVVGIAQVTPTNVTFNIPDAVEVHMGLQTYRRPVKDYVVTGTDDTVAWIIPVSEYYPFRRADRADKPYVEPPDGAHVYFRKSVFPGRLPSLAELERS